MHSRFFSITASGILNLTFLTNLKRWRLISLWRSSGRFSKSTPSFTPLVAAQLYRSASSTFLHGANRCITRSFHIMKKILIKNSKPTVKSAFFPSKYKNLRMGCEPFKMTTRSPLIEKTLYHNQGSIKSWKSKTIRCDAVDLFADF